MGQIIRSEKVKFAKRIMALFIIGLVNCITLHSVDNDSKEDRSAAVPKTKLRPSTSSKTPKQQRTTNKRAGTTRLCTASAEYIRIFTAFSSPLYTGGRRKPPDISPLKIPCTEAP